MSKSKDPKQINLVQDEELALISGGSVLVVTTPKIYRPMPIPVPVPFPPKVLL